MRISIFGIGYVGAVCCGSLAARGHNVIGVDVSPSKVEMINNGISPIVEPGLEELLGKAVINGNLRGTTDAREAIENSDLTMICVGTPSKPSGDLDLRYVEAVSQEIGKALAGKNEWHTVVIRSTVLPGTINNVVRPILEERSGKQTGAGFGLASNPEFLREGTAIADYEFPPMTVIGEHCTRSGDILEELYRDLPGPIIRKSIEVAEMIKYACNVWHALKISFANEIGNIAKALDVDGREVMDVMCEDTKLNISKYYMRPGFAFGGSCLPKDVRALTYRATQLDVKHPLLGAILNSNNHQIERACNIIQRFEKRKVALLGLSFKAGTDDLRESPLLNLAEFLIGKGYELKIYDRNVEYARMNGANKDYINTRIPHVSSLLSSDLPGMVSAADIVILGNNDETFRDVVARLPEDKHVLDLVGFMKSKSTSKLEGICW
ncbi:MAG TPA: UDP-glucose/GDP-mannose dehydrogenase family protein [Gammaproteobacteria bacterium]|nr:UDP-glucose/GDP-mannose dehydrogenase family protein [Gammaproteobacteria bacterium]